MKRKYNKKQSKQENFLISHLRSMASGKWTKARVLNAISLFRMREGRGSGFIGQFWDYVRKGADISIIAYTIFAVRLAPILYIWVGVIYLVCSYLIGYFDETRLKLWQVELDMNTKHVNPYYQRLEKKLDRIDKRLSRWEGKCQTK